MGMFDWVSFENGKARFCGGVRGADDAPHEVLGVKLVARFIQIEG